MIIRGRIHHLLGVVLLATLWVTSLANLSTRATATGVLTDIGANLLQPLFIATGLSPYTLTAQGHDRIMSFLLWFWVATLVLAALALLLDTRSLSRRFSKLFLGAFTGTLPAVLLIAGVWALATFNPQTAAPYVGMLRLVTSSFLPVYGGALAVSGIALILFKVLPMFLGHSAAP